MSESRHYLATALLLALSAAYPQIGYSLLATDGDWSINVEPTNAGADPGLDSWLQNSIGSDSMFRQWFWFRTDTTGPEQSLDSLAFNAGDATGNAIGLDYGNAGDPIQVNVDYALTANSSTSSTINETISITNTSGAATYLSFFAYTDLDLNGGPVDRNAFAQSPQTIIQDDFDGTTTTVFYDNPASRADGIKWEIAEYSSQEDSLNDGGTTTLSSQNITAGGALDYTHAFQWEYNSIADGETVTIAISKEITLGSGSSPFDPVLPPVTPDGDPFVFTDLVVNEFDIWWLDPEVATGYDYSSDTVNFASVTVPGSAVGSTDIGDGLFTVHLFDIGTGDFDPVPVATLNGADAANNTFTFASGGVNQFSIRGIETSANLDPNDPLAFSAGVSFVSAGATTVVMDANRVFIPSGVPTPGTLLLIGAGLFGIRRMAKARSSSSLNGTPIIA